MFLPTWENCNSKENLQGVKQPPPKQRIPVILHFLSILQALTPSKFGDGDQMEKMDELERGRTLYCLAIAHASLNEHAAAVENFKKALAIFKKHQHSDLEARGLLRLASSYVAFPEKAHIALKCYDRAEAICCSESKCTGWQAYIQALRANYLLQMGEHEEAISKLEIATILLQSSEDPHLKCKSSFH